MTPAQPQRTFHRWSFSVGAVAGIDLRVHATFPLLFGWIALSHLAMGQGALAIAKGLLVVVAVFAIVVLHELGHAFAARRFGIRTHDITLLPIGGVARLDRMPTEPKQELLVAIAGPAVNVLLALLFFGATRAFDASASPRALTVLDGPVLAKFLWINVGLALFNLLPAFPMDGGRALRALLAMRMPRVRATDIAAHLGRSVALGFAVIGVIANPMLVVLAFFVWVGATQEAAMVHLTAALESVSVGDAMVTTFVTLPKDAPIARGALLSLHTTQRQFPVVDAATLVGFVSAADLLRRAAEGARDPVSSITHAISGTAAPNEPVEAALARLRETADEVLPVIDAGRLVGMLVPENVLALASQNDAVLARAS